MLIKKMILATLSSFILLQNTFAGLGVDIDSEEMFSPENVRICYQKYLGKSGSFQESSEYNNDIHKLQQSCQGNIQYPVLVELFNEIIQIKISNLIRTTDRSDAYFQELKTNLRQANQVLRNIPPQFQKMKFDIETIIKVSEIRHQIEQSEYNKTTLAQMNLFPFLQFKKLDIETKSIFLLSLTLNLYLKECDQACINTKSLLKQILAHSPELKDIVFNQLKSQAGFSESEFLSQKSNQQQADHTNSAASLISKQCKTASTIDSITYQFGDQFNTSTVIKDVCQQNLKIRTNNKNNIFSIRITIYDSNQNEVTRIDHRFNNSKSAKDYYRKLSFKE